MSGTVDDEVVRMRFDNSAFERGVAATLGTLAKLKSSLNFSGADKGLNDIEAKASHFSLQGMSTGIDGVSKKFLALSTVGVTALSTITNKAVNAGLSMVKSFTTGPISDGFHNYETQINAVQTILANTGLKGASGLATVQKALDNLNTYANQTVYNFSEMTKNIGTFTAAGVALGPATDAIKGIANLAALSGSSSEQASTAMYQLSQAIAANKVGLQDWNSVVNAGLGGKVFQQALFNTGKLQGTLKGVKADETFDQWTKAGNSFRQSLQQGWITGKVLTDTLSQFTGDLTDAQLKAQGYNAEQIKQIQELAKTASGAATNIKTYTQLTSALKEEVATAYATIFKTLFGDINVATKFFSKLHVVLENALTVPIYHLNTLLQTAAKFGGIQSGISAVANAFKLLGAILKPIKQAYRDLFPPATGEHLAKLLNGLDDFIYSIKISTKTASEIRRVFDGVFAIFDIGRQIVSGLAHVFISLFGTVLHGSGGFLEFAASIGDAIVAFDKALKAGNAFTNGFQIITNVLTSAFYILQSVGTAIGELFSRFKPHDAQGMTDSVTGAGNALGRVAKITQNVSDWFAKLPSKIKPGVDAVVNAFKRIGTFIASGFNSQTYNNILKTLQTGLLAGIVILLKKFLSGGLKVDVGGGFLGKMGEMLEGVTGNLKAMQQQLKAKALLEIAIAMGILAASLVAMAAINPQKLATALKAMAVGFGELLGAMGILSKITGSAGFVKIPLMAASLDLLAGAILILTAAVAALSRLSWDELERGLSAVGILLAAVSLASIPLSANSTGMVRAGIGITAMAVAINILYIAVREFAAMSWSDMLKGLAGVGIALVGISVAMRLMPKGMVLQAGALVLIAVALNGIYLAVKSFSDLPWKTMEKGLTGMALALVAIAAAMQLMPPGMVLQAVGLIAVGAALQLISKAVESMAKLSWSDMAHGLVALAGTLAVLAAAMYLMNGTLGGAAALLIVAGALRIFIPSLMALQAMSWSQILKGLGALAATFAVLGLSALALTPVIPSLLALGVALGLVGVAMLAAGAGASLLGVGLTAIAASGGAAIAVLLSGLQGLIALLPSLGQNLATGLVNFITIIGQNAPAIIGAFVSLLTSLLQAVPAIMPSLITAINSIVVTVLTVLTTNAPKIIAAGFQILMDLLNGIKNNIGQVVTTVALIIINFLNALAAQLGPIIAAGVNLLFKFLEGVAQAAGQIPAEVVKLIAIFLGALFASLPQIASAGITLVGKLANGILGAIGKMNSAGVSLMNKLIGAIGGFFGQLVKNGATIVEKIITGIAGGMKDAARAVGNLAKDVGKAILDGIIGGMGDLAGAIGNKIKGAASSAVKKVGGFLGIGGPSMYFANMIGAHISEGVAYGIDKHAGEVTDSLRNMSRTSVVAMQKTISGLGKAISDSSLDYNPTITPVLDLSQVTKDATKINGLVSASPITTSFSYSQAAQISQAQEAARQADTAINDRTETPAVNIELTQNNTSPKALSTIDIYRLTNNQLAQAKQILGISTSS